MPEHMVRRGKSQIWYANLSYLGVGIWDCLGTSDRRIAERRLAEIKLAVEKGEYTAWRTRFRDAASAFTTKATGEQESLIRVHLIPRFGEMRLAEISELDVHRWLGEMNDAFTPESTIKRRLYTLKAVMTSLLPKWKLPKIRCANKGRRLTEADILSEDDVLRVINLAPEHYRTPCLVAAYSMLRLGNVAGLRAGDVDRENGWIRIEKQSKTKKPVSVPISGKLREALDRIKVWPINPNDRLFPDISKKAMSVAIRRTFKAAGVRGSFHSLRHFGACYLINAGVRLEVISKLMGHADVRMTQVYARLKLDVLKDAMGAFDQPQPTLGKFRQIGER